MNADQTVGSPAPSERMRVRVAVQGAVQGVGFRPWIHRLASEFGLTGSVCNTPQGVSVDVEGAEDALLAFLQRLEGEAPPHSAVSGLRMEWLKPAGAEAFVIGESRSDGSGAAAVLPDLAVCPDCLAEAFDPASRRYRYPFTNCTRCGPRYSIVDALPYDRANTTMRSFAMCECCRAEYEDPHDRRFHAQPIACPNCGPRAELWDADGGVIAAGDAVFAETAWRLRGGAIVAVKGVGGFHLMADARSAGAMTRLRARKRRPVKPLALMFRSVAEVKEWCEVDDVEERSLASAAAPIVLLRAKPGAERLLTTAAPGLPLLGCMIGCTPLHHLLLAEVGGPLAATSGNRAEEPICTGELEALHRLRGVADCFLVHDRPIVRPVDDSVVRVMLGRELILRRARGFAPMPVPVPRLPHATLAVGGHQKNTVALAVEDRAVVSQHLGDLDSPLALDSMRRTVRELERLTGQTAAQIVADGHPDYASTQVARRLGRPFTVVQHHYAHALSCMVDNGLEPPALGVAWDGAGFGADGTVWGGEFLRVGASGFERAAHLRTFRLPGGDAAAREPRRSALGVLFEVFGEEAALGRDLSAIEAFSEAELRTMLGMLRNGMNAPITSSAGRLFDAAASIIGLRHGSPYEGRAATELEFLADRSSCGEPYPFGFDGVVLDWAPMICGILTDLRDKTPPGDISARFHRTLAEMIAAAAERIGESRVALTGGCFQNKRLLELTVACLRARGLQPFWHRRLPPNDGGISVGQVAALARRLEPAGPCMPAAATFARAESP